MVTKRRTSTAKAASIRADVNRGKDLRLELMRLKYGDAYTDAYAVEQGRLRARQEAEQRKRMRQYEKELPHPDRQAPGVFRKRLNYPDRPRSA